MKERETLRKARHRTNRKRKNTYEGQISRDKDAKKKTEKRNMEILQQAESR